MFILVIEKKMKIVSSIFCIAVLILSSCSSIKISNCDCDGDTEKIDNEIFPLHVGDYWKYSIINSIDTINYLMSVDNFQRIEINTDSGIKIAGVYSIRSSPKHILRNQSNYYLKCKGKIFGVELSQSTIQSNHISNICERLFDDIKVGDTIYKSTVDDGITLCISTDSIIDDFHYVVNKYSYTYKPRLPKIGVQKKISQNMTSYYFYKKRIGLYMIKNYQENIFTKGYILKECVINGKKYISF